MKLRYASHKDKMETVLQDNTNALYMTKKYDFMQCTSNRM